MQKDLKFKIISEGQKNGVSATCEKYCISRTVYYRWLKRYQSMGIDGLDTIKKNFVPTNKTSPNTEIVILDLIKNYPNYGPKGIKYLLDEMGYDISESAVYNIMKRNNLNHKENRVRFAKKNYHKIVKSMPLLNELNSGECWIFWINDYGSYKNTGKIYEYTIFDLKSRIACTRLYNDISFQNFEDILTGVAMPVSKTLNLKVNYLCFFKDDKIMKRSKNNFNAKLNKIIIENGFDLDVNIIQDSYDDFNKIYSLKNQYTQMSISYIMTLINEESDLNLVKIKFQQYLRNYNINYKHTFYDGEYSPIEYHNKLTNTKRILPIWAYLDRKY